MTYFDLVEKLQNICAKVEKSGCEGHFAAQFNVTGEAEGALYLEVYGDTARIEPYEYFDRDLLVTVDGGDLLAIASGTQDMRALVEEGRIQYQGDIETGYLMAEKLKAAAAPKKTARKTAAKKPAAKKPAAKKPAAKKTAAKKA